MLYKLIRSIVVLLTLSFLACTQAAGPNLTPEEALSKAQSGEITLIDIRTPPEWRQTGVAPMAERIDMQDPRGVSGFAAKVLSEVGGDKASPIALICRTGNRSAYMQRKLQSLGFTTIYNVPEGMVGSTSGPGWIRRGLPVDACRGC